MRLTSDQRDAVTEVINVGVGRAAASLSEMLGRRIELRVPSVSLCDSRRLRSRVEQEDAGVDLSVLQDFSGELSGRALLAFPKRSGIELGKALGELDGVAEELSFDLVGVLEEVGNIVLNGVLGTVGNMTHTRLNYSVPRLAQGAELAQVLAPQATDSGSEDQLVVLADTLFTVADGSIDGSLILLFDIESLRAILDNLMQPA
ncbi:MAG: chemotaxis protein CheC [Planctomycetales bacterium]|nr:chemotaxis protein CheC [Planctomycetales bacterium]